MKKQKRCRSFDELRRLVAEKRPDLPADDHPVSLTPGVYSVPPKPCQKSLAEALWGMLAGTMRYARRNAR